MSKVRLRPAALQDLKSIYTYLADRIGPHRAHVYTSRIRELARSLDRFSERGRRRDDLAPGIRTLNFEGRAIIAYRLLDDAVEIVHVFHAGRDYSEKDFDE